MELIVHACGLVARWLNVKLSIPKLSLSLRRHVNGEIIPALPDDLFAPAAVDELKSDFLKACAVVGESYLSKSLVHLFNVNNVPPKPSVDPSAHPVWSKYLRSRDSSLKKLHPQDIIPLNPAADVDLLRLMGMLHRESEDMVSPSYRVILCDVNIFNRALKVSSRFPSHIMYTSSPKLLSIRMYCEALCLTCPLGRISPTGSVLIESWNSIPANESVMVSWSLAYIQGSYGKIVVPLHLFPDRTSLSCNRPTNKRIWVSITVRNHTLFHSLAIGLPWCTITSPWSSFGRQSYHWPQDDATEYQRLFRVFFASGKQLFLYAILNY